MIKTNKNITHFTNLLRALLEARNFALIIEIVLSIITIFILAGIAVSEYQNNVNKVRKADFFASLGAVKTDAIVEHAITGKWPKKVSQDKRISVQRYASGDAHQLDSVLEAQGSFALFYNIAGVERAYTEAYRLVHVNELQPTLYWACGYTQVREDESIQIPNITDMPVELLTYNCHYKRNTL